MVKAESGDPATDNLKDPNPRILFAVSEVYPLIKTGGLADVACYLPIALHEQGFDIRIVVPAYRHVLRQVDRIKAGREIDIAEINIRFHLLQTLLPDSDIPVYLVDVPELFDRPGGPYDDPAGQDWPDNAERFSLFCRVLRLISLGRAGLDWTPDLLHCHDWHTGLAPALLARDPDRPATLFTIHNLAYQGNFPYTNFLSLKLPAGFWSADALEFYGDLSFIKGGLVYADQLTTVSPGYAREIVTPVSGCGLEGVLQRRADNLTGILNGVDYRIWDPRHDPVIERHYWLDNLAGKKMNKCTLQQELGLVENDKAILLAHISRLTGQKGIDVIIDGLADLMLDEDVQLVVLGTGEEKYEQALRAAAVSHEGRMAVNLSYNEALAHRIQAGADIMLMPSRFEPCGLTQLYSLRYGTIPVVRMTGGLADTVVDTTDASLKDHTATGFGFSGIATSDYLGSVHRALMLYRSGGDRWRRIMSTAMQQEFSWANSARNYARAYAEVLTRLLPA
ncbi:MAG: glycogen synthase GlgA [Gammaproteobacteria bacterium]